MKKEIKLIIFGVAILALTIFFRGYDSSEAWFVTTLFVVAYLTYPVVKGLDNDIRELRDRLDKLERK